MECTLCNPVIPIKFKTFKQQFSFIFTYVVQHFCNTTQFTSSFYITTAIYRSPLTDFTRGVISRALLYSKFGNKYKIGLTQNMKTVNINTINLSNLFGGVGSNPTSVTTKETETRVVLF